MAQTVSIAPPFDGVSPDQTIVRRVADLRFHVLAPYVDTLLSPDAPDWLRLADEPNATLVKRNAVRDVHRLRVGNRAFFVKTYRPATAADAIKQLWRGPACKTEWRIARYAKKYGIDAIQAVAYAHLAFKGLTGPSLLVSEEIKAVRTLSEVWLQLTANGNRKRCKYTIDALSDAVARLIARAHQCGFEHSDMHAGNLLVQLADPQRPRVIFVDLHRANIGRPVHDEAVVRNLAQLNQWFRRHTTNAERLRFLHQYLRHREEFADLSTHAWTLDLGERQLTAALNQCVTRHARKLVAKRDRRARRNGKYFARVKLPAGFRGHALRRSKHPDPDSLASALVFHPDLWSQWISNPGKLFDGVAEENLLKDSHSATVIRAGLRLPDGNGQLDVICKRVLPRNALKRLWYLFRPSRNVRNFFVGHGLRHRHLPTPLPLLAADKRLAGLRTDSILITEYIHNALPLDAFLPEVIAPLASPQAHRARQTLLAAIARLFKRMTRQGVAHRDFKAENLLVRWPDFPDGKPRLYLIDHDGLRLRRKLRSGDVPRMLMRLSLSLEGIKGLTRTDHLRLFKAILRGPGKSDANWKPLGRHIVDLADAKRQQKERRRQWKLKHYGRE